MDNTVDYLYSEIIREKRIEEKQTENLDIVMEYIDSEKELIHEYHCVSNDRDKLILFYLYKIYDEKPKKFKKVISHIKWIKFMIFMFENQAYMYYNHKIKKIGIEAYRDMIFGMRSQFRKESFIPFCGYTIKEPKFDKFPYMVHKYGNMLIFKDSLRPLSSKSLKTSYAVADKIDKYNRIYGLTRKEMDMILNSKNLIVIDKGYIYAFFGIKGGFNCNMVPFFEKHFPFNIIHKSYIIIADVDYKKIVDMYEMFEKNKTIFQNNLFKLQSSLKFSPSLNSQILVLK